MNLRHANTRVHGRRHLVLRRIDKHAHWHHAVVERSRDVANHVEGSRTRAVRPQHEAHERGAQFGGELGVFLSRDAADLDRGHRGVASSDSIKPAKRRTRIGFDHEALAHQKRLVAQRLSWRADRRSSSIRFH